MGKAYTQVTMEERCEIARLRSQGSSVRQIAAGVDRPPSTVARELKRNGSRTLGYQPRYANQQAHARRWRGSRLERDGPLREQVLAGLGAGWSPAQVAGRLALDEGRQIISPESIYRFIYAQMARKKDYSWRHYLPRAKAKRDFRGRRGGSPATHITHRVPLSQRPHAAADRTTFGHWEGDLMHFGNHGPALLALAERHSRLVLLARLPGKGADVTADTIARLLAPLPRAWRQTITFDNGTEFAPHYRLHALGIQTFFCDTRSPWQKGGVENAIGRLRRPLPRKTRLADLSEAAFTKIIQLYNNTPASASATARLPRPLTTRCCTWNVNSPSRLRGNDEKRGRQALMVAEGGGPSTGSGRTELRIGPTGCRCPRLAGRGASRSHAGGRPACG